MPLCQAAILQHNAIVEAQVGTEKNQKEKCQLTTSANTHCDLIKGSEFWQGLQTVVEDLEPICYGTNINQSDKTQPDQVLLTFAGIYLHFS